MLDKPYFFNDPEWYEIFLDKDGMPAVRLTKNAPEKAVNSFNDYFNAKKGLFEFEEK